MSRPADDSYAFAFQNLNCAPNTYDGQQIKVYQAARLHQGIFQARFISKTITLFAHLCKQLEQ